MIKLFIWIVLAAFALWVVAMLAPFVRRNLDKIVKAFRGIVPNPAVEVNEKPFPDTVVLNLSPDAECALRLLLKTREVVADLKASGIGKDPALDTTIAELSKKFDSLIQPELDRLKGVQHGYDKPV